MKFKTVYGYCEQMQSDCGVTINIIKDKTLESSDEYYGTYSCRYTRGGISCNQPSCSVLISNGICVGEKL